VVKKCGIVRGGYESWIVKTAFRVNLMSIALKFAECGTMRLKDQRMDGHPWQGGVTGKKPGVGKDLAVFFEAQSGE
jgi:hypothetical protein